MSINESRIDFEVFTVYRQDFIGVSIVRLCNKVGALEYLMEREGIYKKYKNADRLKYYAIGDNGTLLNLELEEEIKK